MPQTSVAFAVHFVGICHRYRWHLPQISLAFATHNIRGYTVASQKIEVEKRR